MRARIIGSLHPPAYHTLCQPRLRSSNVNQVTISTSAAYNPPSTARNDFTTTSFAPPPPPPPPPTKPALSTVHIGTNYENLCLRVLHRLGFSLTRTGGKSDKGIDLLGVWHAPVPQTSSSSSSSSPSSSASIITVNANKGKNNIVTTTTPLRVIIQCKAHTGQVTPALIRELEGAVAGAPAAWRSSNLTTTGGGDTIAVLCSPKGATPGIRSAVRMAERGVVWATIVRHEQDEVEGEEEGVGGRITQLLWNDRVKKLVREGLATGLRYRSTSGSRKGTGTGRIEPEVVLLLDGKVWEYKDAVGREEGERRV